MNIYKVIQTEELYDVAIKVQEKLLDLDHSCSIRKITDDQTIDKAEVIIIVSTGSCTLFNLGNLSVSRYFNVG